LKDEVQESIPVPDEQEGSWHQFPFLFISLQISLLYLTLP